MRYIEKYDVNAEFIKEIEDLSYILLDVGIQVSITNDLHKTTKYFDTFVGVKINLRMPSPITAINLRRSITHKVWIKSLVENDDYLEYLDRLKDISSKYGHKVYSKFDKYRSGDHNVDFSNLDCIFIAKPENISSSRSSKLWRIEPIEDCIDLISKLHISLNEKLKSDKSKWVKGDFFCDVKDLSYILTDIGMRVYVSMPKTRSHEYTLTELSDGTIKIQIGSGRIIGTVGEQWKWRYSLSLDDDYLEYIDRLEEVCDKYGFKVYTGFEYGIGPAGREGASIHSLLTLNLSVPTKKEILRKLSMAPIQYVIKKMSKE